MGTKLPPNEPGVACPVCWGDGKEFGDFVTPLVLPVRFLNLQPGQFWIPGDEQLLLMPHLMEQGAFVCNWELTFCNYTVQLSYGVFGSALFMINDDTGKFLFAAEPDELCVTRFENNRITPGGNQTFNGVGIIEIPQEPFE